jgi:DNA mismatch repair protein MutS2
MEKRTLRILEFDKIKERIRTRAACSLGKERLSELKPCESMIEANLELETVDEAIQVLYRTGTLPFGGITDIRQAVQKAAIGGTLSGETLIAIANFIAGGRNIRHSIEKASEMFGVPRLSKICELLFDAKRVEQEIRQAIDDDGSLFDNASSLLRSIRSEKRGAEAKARQVLEQLLRTQQKYLQEQVIAMRGSYYCLPVRVDSKGQIRGIVRDYSASGSTVFIEPQGVIEATERIRALTVDEEHEIEQILHNISGLVAGIDAELAENANLLGQIDSWFAKAGYAKQEGFIRPNLNREGIWRLKGAKHPLLDGNIAVPIDVSLGEAYSMLIVTGPNTGGKTVSLKTIGLITVMAMSGCFVPGKSICDVAWCSDIFADIGDEQSIEQSLSTFSSHMRTIIAMLGHVQKDSLVLLDELGAGTDPGEGSALAISILDYLNGTSCSVVATTHYAELKGYAFTEPNAINASVEFDVVTLRPTYRLLIGVPGRSNALAIAGRLGLDQSIIDKAKTLVGAGDTRTDELILQMERARKIAEDAELAALQNREDAESLKAKWQRMHDELELQGQKAKDAAFAKAEQIVKNAEAEADRIIRELRSKQNSAVVKDHELVALRKGLESALPVRNRTVKRKLQIGVVQVGHHVRVLSLGQKGDVTDVSQDGKSATVQLGLLRMKVDTADIEILDGGGSGVRVSSSSGGSGRGNKGDKTPVITHLGTDTRDISMELDVRGETVDEALLRIDKYIDDAVISGLRRIVIIHGKGTGALRDAVRRYLSNHPQVSARMPGGRGEGGDGVTVVAVRT